MKTGGSVVGGFEFKNRPLPEALAPERFTGSAARAGNQQRGQKRKHRFASLPHDHLRVIPNMVFGRHTPLRSSGSRIDSGIFM